MVIPARRCCSLPGGAAGWERLVPAGTAGVSAGVWMRETPEPKQDGRWRQRQRLPLSSVWVCVYVILILTTQNVLNERMFEMRQMWRVQSLCFVNAPECVTAWGHLPGSSVIICFICVGEFVCISFALSLAVSLDCHPSVSFSSSSFPQRLPVLCPVPLTHSHLI